MVLTLPELDPAFMDAAQQNILADIADGKMLPEKQGPVRIVVPQKRRARGGFAWLKALRWPSCPEGAAPDMG